MKYVVCYEDQRFEYRDAYETYNYALEYAEEAVERGFTNVRVETVE
jgi:hypothetical protein